MPAMCAGRRKTICRSINGTIDGKEIRQNMTNSVTAAQIYCTVNDLLNEGNK